MKYFSRPKKNPVAIVGIEKALIDKHYKFIDCKVQGGILFCDGSYQPTEESITYHYRIKYAPHSKPAVYVKYPVIEYNDDIHMYPKDNSLCLYHRSDMTWDSSVHHLHNTIIPWTHEWFVFYELYIITGDWLHPFVPHQTGNKQ